MSDEKRPFYQDLLLILIPSVIAAFSAYIASDAKNSATDAADVSRIVQERQEIIQIRLDELSYIGPNGYLLPVGNDDMWRDYLGCRAKTSAPNDRVFCSKQIENKQPDTTHNDAATSINLY
jgi:hypothetical protein